MDAASLSERVKRCLLNASKQVEDWIRSSGQFQSACDQAFLKLDARGLGRLSVTQAATACVCVFGDISQSLEEYGIVVCEPTVSEVEQILRNSNYTDDDKLDRAEFEELYVAILKWAAYKGGVGFVQKYGLGMLAGTIGMVALKRGLRAIPGVGSVLGPIIGLLPALIVGPVLGVAAVYTHDQGDLLAVQKKLFPERRGQFRAE